MTVLSLLGGLALLLYGMQMSGEGLQRAAGGHLRHLLTSMTRTRLSAVGAGALVTALIQSSSVVVLPYDSTDQVTSGVLVDAIACGRPAGTWSTR